LNDGSSVFVTSKAAELVLTAQQYQDTVNLLSTNEYEEPPGGLLGFYFEKKS
jgi:hypothetical protein